MKRQLWRYFWVFTLWVGIWSFTLYRSGQLKTFLLNSFLTRLSESYKVNVAAAGLGGDGVAQLKGVVVSAIDSQDTLLYAHLLSFQLGLRSLIQNDFEFSTLRIDSLHISLPSQERGEQDGEQFDLPNIEIFEVELEKVSLATLRDKTPLFIDSLSLQADRVSINTDAVEILGGVFKTAFHPSPINLDVRAFRDSTQAQRWKLTSLSIQDERGLRFKTHGFFQMDDKGQLSYELTRTALSIGAESFEYFDFDLKEHLPLTSIQLLIKDIQGNAQQFSTRDVSIKVNDSSQLSFNLSFDRSDTAYIVSAQKLKIQTSNVRHILPYAIDTLAHKMIAPLSESNIPISLSGYLNYESQGNLFFALDIKSEQVQDGASLYVTGQADLMQADKKYLYASIHYDNIILGRYYPSLTALSPLYGYVVLDAVWQPDDYQTSFTLDASPMSYDAYHTPPFSLKGELSPDEYAFQLSGAGKGKQQFSGYAILKEDAGGYIISSDITTDTLSLRDFFSLAAPSERLKFHLRGQCLINPSGEISYLKGKAQNVFYADTLLRDTFEEVSFYYQQNEHSHFKHLHLYTPEKFSLKMEGMFFWDKLDELLKKTLTYTASQGRFIDTSGQYLNLHMSVEDKKLATLFDRRALLGADTRLYFCIGSQDFDFEFSTSKLGWADYKAADVSISYGSDFTDHIWQMDSLSLPVSGVSKFVMKSHFVADTIKSQIALTDIQGEDIGRIKLFRTGFSPHNMAIGLDTSYLNIAGSRWALEVTPADSKHPLEAAFVLGLDRLSFEMQPLILQHRTQKIQAQLRLLRDTTLFNLSAEQLQLASFDLGSKSLPPISGVIEQQFEYAATPHSQVFNLQLDISDLKIDTLSLPDLHFQAEKLEPHAIHTALFLDGDVVAKGNLLKRRLGKETSLSWTFDHIELEALGLPVGLLGFLIPKDALTDFGGLAEVQAVIDGAVSQPTFSVDFTLFDAGFRIAYLNTFYSFSDGMKLYLDDRSLRIPEASFFDMSQNPGKVSAIFRHDRFADLKYRIDIKSDKIHCLDTDESSFEPYFGAVYADAHIWVEGTLDHVSVSVPRATLLEGWLTIPLNQPGKSDPIYDFVSFDAKKTPLLEERQTESEQDDFTFEVMLSNTKISPGVKVNVLPNLDADPIEVEGVGSLFLRAQSGQPVEMTGDYTIYSGYYDFPITEIVGLSRLFSIKKGSPIHWDGSPYEPSLDVSVSHLTRSSLSAYLNNPSYYASLDISLDLKLEGSLSDLRAIPQIRLLNASNEVELEFEQKMLAQQEVYKQFFSLLVLGGFTRADPSTEQTTALSSTNPQDDPNNTYAKDFATQVLNSFSDIITPGSEGLHLSFSHNPTSSVLPTTSQSEWEVKLQGNLLEDRLVLGGVFGLPTAGTTNDLPQTQTAQQRNSGIGLDEASLDWKLTESQSLRYFYKRNNGIFDQQNNIYRQGVGFSFQRNFDAFGDLFRSSE